MPFSYATPQRYMSSAEAGGADARDLSTLDGPSADAEADTAQLQEALEAGTREIDPIMAARYDIAALRLLTPAPRYLIDANIAIARYLLDIRYGAREGVQQRYEEVIAKLRRIAAGKEELLDDEGAIIATAVEGGPVTSAGLVGRGKSRFTRDNIHRLMGHP
jgi:phage gp36-like protein